MNFLLGIFSPFLQVYCAIQSGNGPKMWRKLKLPFRAEKKAHNPVTSVAVMVFSVPKNQASLTKALSTARNSMTSSAERPSPEPFLKKEASPAVLRVREFSKCSEGFKCLPAVLSKGKKDPGKALRAFPESFRNFLQKVPAILGVWPKIIRARLRGRN